MLGHHRIDRRLIVGAIVGSLVLSACGERTPMRAVAPNDSAGAPVNAFTRSVLIGDAAERGGATVDANLTEPWGLAFGKTGTLWVANYTSGTSTLYDRDGTKHSRVVTIDGGTPTGIVRNDGADFAIAGGPASWIFAGEYGYVTAWNAASNEARVVIDNRGAGAFYKGIAIASVASGSRLYLTNFAQNEVEVYDGTFNRVASFTDSSLPDGYAPFGIQNIDGKLVVTFARQLGPSNEDDDAAPGNGFVDVFSPDGVLLTRFASRGALNSPWAVTVAPAGFGPFGGDVLVANFGDGTISVFDQGGKFIDVLRDENKAPIAIGGLWGIGFAPVAGSTSLYFTACPDGGNTGIIGTLHAK